MEWESKEVKDSRKMCAMAKFMWMSLILVVAYVTSSTVALQCVPMGYMGTHAMAPS